MELCLNSKEIAELKVDELELVNGGRRRFGTGRGGIFSARNIAGGLRFAGGLGLLYSSYNVGYSIGSFGYSTYSNFRYGRKK